MTQLEHEILKNHFVFVIIESLESINMNQHKSFAHLFTEKRNSQDLNRLVTRDDPKISAGVACRAPRVAVDRCRPH